jgi:hypothetical protein
LLNALVNGVTPYPGTVFRAGHGVTLKALVNEQATGFRGPCWTPAKRSARRVRGLRFLIAKRAKVMAFGVVSAP